MLISSQLLNTVKLNREEYPGVYRAITDPKLNEEAIRELITHSKNRIQEPGQPGDPFISLLYLLDLLHQQQPSKIYLPLSECKCQLNVNNNMQNMKLHASIEYEIRSGGSCQEKKIKYPACHKENFQKLEEYTPDELFVRIVNPNRNLGNIVKPKYPTFQDRHMSGIIQYHRQLEHFRCIQVEKQRIFIYDGDNPRAKIEQPHKDKQLTNAQQVDYIIRYSKNFNSPPPQTPHCQYISEMRIELYQNQSLGRSSLVSPNIRFTNSSVQSNNQQEAKPTNILQSNVNGTINYCSKSLSNNQKPQPILASSHDPKSANTQQLSSTLLPAQFGHDMVFCRSPQEDPPGMVSQTNVDPHNHQLGQPFTRSDQHWDRKMDSAKGEQKYF